MAIYKCFFDFTKEEKWLADMARKGYYLRSASNGRYKFDYVGHSLGEQTYRIDYRTFLSNNDFINYCTLFEDSGWLHIAGSIHSGSQYFVKVGPDASDDIFSDNRSRAGRYKRIARMWLDLTIIYGAIFFTLYNSKNSSYLPLYLTPGLWELKGWRFVLAFLFETPFALLRLSPILVVSFYAYFTIKSYILYKKEIKFNKN